MSSSILPTSSESLLLSDSAAESDVFVFPVSFAQQRLWFLEQLDPDSGQYNMATAVQIEGAVQAAVLQQSLQYLTNRHESLRTTFRTVAGELMQVVHPHGSVSLTVVNGTQMSRTDQWQQQLVTEAQRPFDLAQDALRVTLLQVTPTENILLLVVHHIISDGWSLNILVQELAIVYAAIASGRTPALPDLPIQYADFAIWQRDWLEQGERDRQLQYWQKQLQGLAPLQLATDFPRPAIATGNGTRQTWTLSVDLTRGLRQLSQQSQVTLYMTLLAAWQTLLYRYSGQDDIVVGSPVANRNQVETQELIGCFVNTLVLRSSIQDGLTFRQFLAQVKHTVLAAYEHQNLPFETLVDALQPKRDLSRNPLFQVWFALNHASTETLEILGLNWNAINLKRSTTQFDLSLEMVDQGQTLTATVEYSTDLFEAETIVRLWNHFQVLLAGILKNSDTALSELPLLTPIEEKQALWDWNQTQIKVPQHLCIHQLFEQQVAQTPDAIAAVDPRQQLTYAELNHRANCLAHYLQQRGVRPETLVGVCLDRSVNLLVGILGILKAGGAYVPLDPAYPRDRLAFMLEDTQLSVLVTQADLAADLPISAAVQLIELDRQWSAITQQPNSNLPNHVQPDNLAYLIYTSGSTGRTKGVMIEHRSLVNAYFAWEAAYKLRSEIRCHLQMASFSFDVFTGDWVRALCSGGRLVLCPRDILIDPPLLYAFIQQYQIDAAEFVPAVSRPLAQYVQDHQQRLDNFKLLICGSDTWTWQDYRQIRQLCAPTTRLINSFGVTEATIDSSYFEADIDNGTSANLPIGRPFANTQLYILDRHRQPVPVGVPGELYIGGAGLARGYWQRPELTAERFIPHPFTPDTTHLRLYKTGDVARFQPDGTIEFWGRADHQVKLRGYRIELGEIETVLSHHSQVQTAVVTVHTDDTGYKRLVAYVVPSAFTKDCDSWLKDHSSSFQQHLKAQLPEYMVPAVFVALSKLPITPNGKVDRRSLPAPHYVPPSSEATAPQTPIEQTLVQIWSEVLGLEQVGIHDNFFALGGDSILSIQIIAKANQAGLHLTPKQLFQHQTIADLATVADTTVAVQADQGRVTGIVPLTPIQQWFFEQPWQVPHHWNQSVLLEVRQPLNLQWLEQTLHCVVEHHDVLRSRFWQTEQGWQQEIVETVPNICPIEIDLTALPVDAQISALSAKATELQASLDLSQGILLRVALFNLIINGKPAQRLLLVIHHLVVDGVSWRILLEDLQTAYQQRSQGQNIQLPAKTTSFQQWAQQLQEYAQTEELRQQQAYWQDQLQGPEASRRPSQSTPLPLDRTTGANTVATTQILSVSLTVEETQILLQELPQCYHTQINDVLLTALVHTFTNWTGASTLWVDLEGHGREPLFSNVDTSRTVGWFTSVFPVCLQAAKTVQATLKQVKANLRQIPQNGIGYGLLRYLANAPLNNLSIQPEVSFNYFGQFDTATSATALFSLASESEGVTRSEVDLRTYLLEINSSVVGGRFQIDWSYSTARHQQETIAHLAEGFLAVLRSLIQNRTTASPCYTPSDFPLVRLDQASLDQVIARSIAAQQQAQGIESIYPLSPIQQGLLFHVLYHSGLEAYFTQTWGTLIGSLNVTAFREAWQRVVDQHPILRTAFVWEQLDAPLQVAYRQVTLPFEQQDWRHLSTSEQQQQWQAWLQRDRRRGCDPAQAPLMRITLIQFADDRYQFAWSHHHLLLDGWSTPLLLQDVLLSYEAYCQQQVPRLPSSRGYGQYIAWLEGQSLDQAESFWRQTLQGFLQPTPLPGNAIVPSTESQDEAYAEFEVKLSAATSAALQDFSRQHQITLNTLMQGSWALLLSHASNQPDVVFGATVSGRPTDLPGADAMIGLFINTLPVRVQIHSNLSLLDWLKVLQAQQVEARQYEYSPLTQIQRWSQLPQGVPLFNSVLVFENYPVGADTQPDLQGVQIQAVQSAIRNHYPLTLRVSPQEEISLLWMYDSNQLPTATVQHCAKQLVNLLEVITNQSQASIQELLQVLQHSDRQAQTAKAQTLDQLSRSSFQRTRRKAISSS